MVDRACWERGMTGQNGQRRGRRRSSGKWAVQRERCNLAPGERAVSVDKERPIGEAISRVMTSMGLAAEHWSVRLGEEWSVLVGPEIAKHTRPGRLEGGELTVFVDHSIWLAELSRYSSRKLLANLQAHFGKKDIKTLRFSLDPGG